MTSNGGTDFSTRLQTDFEERNSLGGLSPEELGDTLLQMRPSKSNGRFSERAKNNVIAAAPLLLFALVIGYLLVVTRSLQQQVTALQGDVTVKTTSIHHTLQTVYVSETELRSKLNGLHSTINTTLQAYALHKELEAAIAPLASTESLETTNKKHDQLLKSFGDFKNTTTTSLGQKADVVALNSLQSAVIAGDENMTARLEAAIAPLASTESLETTNEQHDQLFNSFRDFKNTTTTLLGQKADVVALNSLRSAVIEGDKNVTASIMSVIGNDVDEVQQSITNLQNSKADEAALVNLSSLVATNYSTKTELENLQSKVTTTVSDLHSANSSVDVRINNAITALDLSNTYATIKSLSTKADVAALSNKASNRTVADLQQAVEHLRNTSATQEDYQANAADIQKLNVEFAAVSCGSIECGIGGMCAKANLTSPECQCRTGFQPDEPIPASPCNDCSALYTKTPNGRDCERNLCMLNDTTAPSGASPKDCGHGTCQVPAGTCACHWGYTGDACDECAQGFTFDAKNTCIIDVCWDNATEALKTCGDHGTCQRSGTQYPPPTNCKCDNFYDQDSNCTQCSVALGAWRNPHNNECEQDHCKLVHGKLTDPCNGHATACDQETGQCTCEDGYLPGDDTQQCTDCHVGYNKTEDGTCKWDSCNDVDCNHGHCQATPGQPTPLGYCVCENGFATPDCVQCKPGYVLGPDGAKCQADACHPNGTYKCSEPGTASCGELTGYNCHCNHGYAGTTCASCDPRHYETNASTCEPDPCKAQVTAQGSTDPKKKCGQTTNPQTGQCLSPSQRNNFTATCQCNLGHAGEQCQECDSPGYIELNGVCEYNPCWDHLRNKPLECTYKGQSCSNDGAPGTTGNCVCPANETLVHGQCEAGKNVFIKIWGAGGGAGNTAGPVGGAGGYVQGAYTYTPGETLSIVVGTGGTPCTLGGGILGGGAGKPNGGPSVGSQNCGGGGGGSSYVVDSRGIVIAGAGGGGGAGDLSGGGGGGGLHANSTGIGGEGCGCINHICFNAAKGTNGGGGGGGSNTTAPGATSDFGGAGGPNRHNGANSNGAGGAYSDALGGGGGGGGAYSAFGLLPETIYVQDAKNNEPVNTQDPDYTEVNGGAGGVTASSGRNGKVVIIGTDGTHQVFSTDGHYTIP